MIMLILDSPSNDPLFNIAAEEYLLKETGGEYAFFYINEPCVIIGKHQNAWAEINLPWIRQHGIPVIRRITGGGTVWHDPGNLNFTFIRNGEEGKLVNFREYAGPVLEFLKELPVPAEFGERNEILVDGLKVSGNAECVHRNRVLHHGTLLYRADLEMLAESLEKQSGRYEDRAVQSIRSGTGNIADFLDPAPDIADFRRYLIRHIIFSSPGMEITAFTDAETGRIRELILEKYSRWEWNFGYSPRYRFNNEWMIGKVQIRVELETEKGRITACRLSAVGKYPYQEQISFTGSPPPEPSGNENVEEAKDYGILEDILGNKMPDLDMLAESLIGELHDPDALRKSIAQRKLVDPEWIDIFVKGLF